MSDRTSTRQELIAAAQQLVVDGGWEIVTTRRVAERAGVSPGLVHYHVGSIEGLRRAAACEGARSLLEGPFREALEAPNLREGLLAFLLRLDLEPDHLEVILFNEALVGYARRRAAQQPGHNVLRFFAHLTEGLTAHEVPRHQPVAPRTRAVPAVRRKCSPPPHIVCGPPTDTISAPRCQ